MILEQIVIDILKEDIPKLDKHVKWDDMYNRIAKKIVKSIKQALVE